MAKKKALKKKRTVSKEDSLREKIIASGRFAIRFAATNPDESRQSVFGTKDQVEQRITEWASRADWDRDKVEEVEVVKVAVLEPAVDLSVDFDPDVTIDD